MRMGFARRRLRALWVVMMVLLAGVGVLCARVDSVAAADAPGGAADSATLLVKLAAADGDAAGRRAILEQLARTGDQRLEGVFADFNEGSLYLWNGRVVSCKKMEGSGDAQVAPLDDPFTRQPVLQDGKPAIVPAKDVKPISASRRDRTAARDALSLLRLSNPDRDLRLAAVVKSGEGAVEGNLPALEAMEKTEKDAAIKAAITESIALIHLARTGDDPDSKAVRLSAAQALGQTRSARALARLTELRAAEKDSTAAAAFDAAIGRIQQWQSIVQWAGNIFSGLSLSSILILMALGLSIIFGLMGVINMAHGELMMIGAYATFLTQQAFVKYLPESAFNWYFVAAIPLSFLAAALVGILIEATVIRFLYGRPLDTLLATIGVSYILIQGIRVEFGDNIAVNSPTWLRGSYEIVQDLRLPYNRLFIIGFCLACIALMYFIVERTKLGLLLRATTQNRQMAATLGVSTRRIDMLTFGLGAGLAGLAGCALTQVGGVTPNMGQNYIIDSFLVVVTGGVGKLAGAIWSGLGLGMVNKFLEPFVGAVWGKVLILVLVVAFIQWRPSGLFPAKGRNADV